LWDVLSSYRQAPTWVWSKVMDLVTRCVKDPSYSNQWAIIDGRETKTLHLNEEECDRVLPYVEEEDVIVRNRMFLGESIDTSVLVLNNTWSMALKLNFDTDTAQLFEMLEESIPKDVYPKAGNGGKVDIDEVLASNHKCAWLDDVWRHGKIGNANGARDNRQPLRRTASVTLIDDLLMLHSMVFSHDTDETGCDRDGSVRVAMVIRLLSTVGEFYTDTSTMRLTGESLNYRGEHDVVHEVCRDVYT
jgi:hypothetical protein